MINNNIRIINIHPEDSFKNWATDNPRMKIKTPQRRYLSKIPSTKCELDSLIDKFKIINPEFHNYLKVKYFGYFENTDKRLVKIFNDKQLKNHYNYLLKIYDNYMNLIQLINNSKSISPILFSHFKKEFLIKSNEILLDISNKNQLNASSYIGILNIYNKFHKIYNNYKQIRDLIDKFKKIDAESTLYHEELSSYLEKEFFGNLNPEKISDAEQLDTTYEVLSEVYENYKRVIELCNQIRKNLSDADPQKFIDLERNLAKLHNRRLGIDAQIYWNYDEKIFSYAEEIEALKEKKKLLTGISPSENLDECINIQNKINGLEHEVSILQLRKDSAYTKKLETSKYITKIFIRADNLIKNLIFSYDFFNIKKEYEELLRKNRIDDMDLNFQSFLYLNQVFKKNPADVDYSLFYSHVDILRKKSLLPDYKIKSIHTISYEAQKVVREKKLNEKLEKLNDELAELSAIDSIFSNKLKRKLSEANEFYQKVAEICEQSHQNPEAEDSSQENTAMIIVQDYLGKLVEQCKNMEKEADLLSQQIEEEKKLGKNVDALKNHLDQLEKVLELLKIISNCAAFCTINKLENATVYMGSLFDDSSIIFIGNLAKSLYLGEKPRILLFKNLKQYKKYKKDFEEIKQKIKSIDPKNPSTFLTSKVLNGYENYVQGGTLYKYYETEFGCPSNGFYLTKEECDKLKTKFTHPEHLYTLTKYQAFWIYEEQLNEPPKFYDQVNFGRFFYPSHGLYNGTTAGDSLSNPLSPSETAKHLKEYDSSKFLYLEFDGCFIGDSIDGINTGVALIMKKLSEYYYITQCIAYEQSSVIPYKNFDRMKYSSFGTIYTDPSLLRVIAYRDPFTDEINTLRI